MDKEAVKLVLEVAGSEPVYETGKDGAPIYVGRKVHFGPVVVDHDDYVRLAALPPYSVEVTVKEV